MVRIPPPIWMFIFIAISGSATILYPSMRIAHQPVLGVMLTVAGAGLGFWAFGVFRKEGTEIKPTSTSNKKLVIRGPYRFTRNPMYLCLVLFSLGIALWAGALAMLAVPVLVFAMTNWVHIPFEEAKMRHQFGSAFSDYERAVRRWI